MSGLGAMTGPAQLPLDLPHRPAMAREDFLVAACNQDAVGWIDLWPCWPGPALMLCGPAGCGKTHLAQVWRRRCGAGQIAGAALAPASVPAVLAAGGDVPGIVVDEAAAVAGDPGRERGLLHLYNLVRAAGGHLLLTAEQPPARWDIALPDLASRLAAAPVATVGAPDDAVLAAILVKLFADRQIRVGADIVAYAVPRMERSFAAAQALVARADAAALASHRRITVPLLRGLMERQPDETVPEDGHAPDS